MGRSIPLRLVVDSLLLLTFVWMGLSGVLISKMILTNIATTNVLVKMYHMCVGGLSVVLLGVHIGLHMCRKAMPSKLAIALTIAVLAGGIDGVSTYDIV